LLGLLVGEIDGLLASVAVSGPQLGVDAAAFADEDGELWVGRLDGDVVLLDKLANSGAGGGLLAEVKTQLLQSWREFDGLGCHCHFGLGSYKSFKDYNPWDFKNDTFTNKSIL